MSEPNLLSILRKCHNSNPWKDSSLHPFLLTPSGPQIGFLPPSVFSALKSFPFASNEEALIQVEFDGKAAFSFSADSSHESRSKLLSEVAQKWREEKTFPDPLDGWRDELYSIYGPKHRIAFSLERSACALFGLMTFGVHLTAYTQDGEDLRIWVPKRSKTKSTWPGALDNSVAGGITAGDGPMESMIRECGEEAGLSPDLVKKHIKNTGVISYFYQTQSGFCQPEVEYTYDLPLPANIKLIPVDGEAESFQLLPWREVLKLVRLGEFKPNCALVLIDFFFRHGCLKVEDEPDYLEISAELKNHLGLPGP